MSFRKSWWVRSTVPPTVASLFEQRLDEVDDVVSLRNAMTDPGRRKALLEAAEATMDGFAYEDSPRAGRHDSSFVMSADREFNPLADGAATCLREGCRLKRARLFAAAAGLYSDYVVIQDSVTTWFAEEYFDADWTWARLKVDLQILRTWKPLIADGTIRFSHPHAGMCPICLAHADVVAKRATLELLKDFAGDFSAHLSSDPTKRSLHLELPMDTSLHVPTQWAFDLTSSEEEELRACPPETLRDIALRRYAEVLAPDTEAEYMNLVAAEHVGAIVLSRSVLHSIRLQYIRDATGEQVGVRTEVPQYELPLSWLSELNATQIAILRSEATEALPRLRTLMRLWTRDRGTMGDHIRELSEQATEVRAELNALYRRKERHFASITGLTTLFCSVRLGVWHNYRFKRRRDVARRFGHGTWLGTR